MQTIASPRFSHFINAHPTEWGWINEQADKGNTFAMSLRAGVNRYGALTPNQLAAVQRNIAQPRAERPAPVGTAVEADDLLAAFNRAKASGLKYPKLHLGDFVVSLAPDTGKNPGALYVKDEGGTYLGKVSAGKFFTSRECSQPVAGLVTSLMKDPAAVLDAYGRRTGNCGCCNRPLTASESVQRGIGPVCAVKWGL